MEKKGARERNECRKEEGREALGERTTRSAGKAGKVSYEGCRIISGTVFLQYFRAKGVFLSGKGDFLA